MHELNSVIAVHSLYVHLHCDVELHDSWIRIQNMNGMTHLPNRKSNLYR